MEHSQAWLELKARLIRQVHEHHQRGEQLIDRSPEGGGARWGGGRGGGGAGGGEAGWGEGGWVGVGAGQVGDVAGEEPVQGDHDEDEDFQADVDGEEQDKVEIR